MNEESKYLNFLPALYQQGKDDPQAELLGNFIKAFEKILSGREDGPEEIGKGIEEILDQSDEYFNPGKTPPEFLKWLAGCVALTLREGEDWNAEDFSESTGPRQQLVPLKEERKTRNRDLISKIVPLYQERGTREGLEKYLKIYVGEEIDISINEFNEPFQMGESVMGEDTIVGDGRPFYFEVHMVLPAPNPSLMEQKKREIKNIIDKEKPAHTYYDLTIEIPTMEIGEHSTIGADTLLGGQISS